MKTVPLHPANGTRIEAASVKARPTSQDLVPAFAGGWTGTTEPERWAGDAAPAVAQVTNGRRTPKPTAVAAATAASRTTPAPRPQAAAASKPGVIKSSKLTVGDIVSACVASRMIVDSPESRKECATWVAADASRAVITLGNWRQISAAKAAKPNVAASVTPRPMPTPAATTYPAGWSPARAPHASGVRVGASSKILHNDAMATPRVAAGRSVAQPVSSPRNATAFIAASTATAEANRNAAQAGRNGYTDPHDLIAATNGQAKAQQAAEAAEIARKAAAHTARFGTPTLSV